MTKLRRKKEGSGVIKKKNNDTKHLVLERGSLPSNSLVCTTCSPNICAPELEQNLRANCKVNSAGDIREFKQRRF